MILICYLFVLVCFCLKRVTFWLRGFFFFFFGVVNLFELKDLLSIGITALGPRKKIVHALSQLRKGSGQAIEADTTCHAPDEPGKSTNGVDSASKVAANKLITDYFPGFSTDRKRVCNSSKEQRAVVKRSLGSGRKPLPGKKNFTKGKLKDPPSWCCVPGTPFRVVNDFSVLFMSLLYLCYLMEVEFKETLGFPLTDVCISLTFKNKKTNTAHFQTA